MAKTAEIAEVSLTDLHPYERNAKIHDAAQVEKIAESIKEFGFVSPCLIDRQGNIIAGHGRVEAAKRLGLTKVPCVYIEGLTDTQRRAYILADNRLTELGGWNNEIIDGELKELTAEGFDITLTGFTIDEITFDEFEEDETEELEQIAPAEPLVHRGELWQLGRHRLMCGDSTDPDDMAKLMGGEEADLLLTDPPYNVALGTDASGHAERPSEAKARHRRTDGLIIPNDSFETSAEYIEFLRRALTAARDALRPGAAFYIWLAANSYAETLEAMKQTGLEIRQHLVWVKNTFALGRQDYQWRHEPCLYGWKEGAPHYFINLRSLSTVSGDDPRAFDRMTREEAVAALSKYLDDAGTILKEDKPTKSELHPTMKPLGLMRRLIRNSTRPGELVLDVFGGSGSTLIAAEQQGRRCVMMELDEAYSSTIVRRFEQETGEKAVRI